MREAFAWVKAGPYARSGQETAKNDKRIGSLIIGSLIGGLLRALFPGTLGVYCLGKL